MLAFNSQTQQYNYSIPDCHKRLNQYGRLALQNKQQTCRSLFHSKKMNESIQSRKKSIQNNEKTLSKLLESDTLQPPKRALNPQLQKSIQKLQMLGLNSPKAIRLARYEGSIKVPTVYNDYHSPKTNHGYSRSQTGAIFPK